MCDRLDRSMDPADELLCEEPYFQWDRWLALCEKWHPEAVGMFALSSYVPPNRRCFAYLSKFGRYDVDALDASWAFRFNARVSALIAIGVRPIIHVLEFCGANKEMFKKHPWNPVNNINGVGFPKYTQTIGPDGLDIHKSFFRMLWNALKPADRKEVIWTTGNEPPPYAVPQQIAFAQWLRTQGVAYDHLWSVVSEHIVNEFDASKPWKKSVNAIVAHGMASVKDIDAMKTTYLGVNKSIIPHTDGGVQMMSLKPATLRAMLRRYPSTSVMWNLPEGFDRTKQAAWDAVWKHTGALMKVMAEV